MAEQRDSTGYKRLNLLKDYKLKILWNDESLLNFFYSNSA